MKTSKELHKLHKALWTWLSNNPSKMKEDWPGWLAFDSSNKAFRCALHYYCFACQEAKNRRDNEQDDQDICHYCPLDWEDTLSCLTPESVFTQWKVKSDFTRRTVFASRIKNLKWE